MEYLKTKKRRVVVPKKKKAKKKPYFGMDVQDAIVRYNALDADKNQVERNKIYQEEIHAAFDKLCENIINTFKFTYFDDGFEDVKQEVTSFLVDAMYDYSYSHNQIYFEPQTVDLFQRVGKSGEAIKFVKVIPDKVVSE